MTDDQAERLINVLADIAGCLKSIAATMELDHQRRYPPKQPAKEATITYVPTEEEKIISDTLGDDREAPIERWTTIGPRESEFVRADE